MCVSERVCVFSHIKAWCWCVCVWLECEASKHTPCVCTTVDAEMKNTIEGVKQQRLHRRSPPLHTHTHTRGHTHTHTHTQRQTERDMYTYTPTHTHPHTQRKDTASLL